MAEALSTEQIEERIRDLPGWTTDGRKIERSYSVQHIQGAAFVVHIAAIQDDFGHHSDATLGYKAVHISISSSDLGGYVAEHDVELARRIEAAALASTRRDLIHIASKQPRRGHSAGADLRSLWWPSGPGSALSSSRARAQVRRRPYMTGRRSSLQAVIFGSSRSVARWAGSCTLQPIRCLKVHMSGFGRSK